MILDSGEVVRRLDEARRRAPDGLVAFDADGTLWDGDVGVDLFECAIRERVFREEARAPLLEAARTRGLDAGGDANELASAIYDAFNAERFPDHVMFEIMAWAFAGFSPRAMNDFAKHVLGLNRLSSRITAELSPVLGWARETHTQVVVVSASPRAIVEPGILVRDLGAAHVIAMTPTTKDDVITPSVEHPTPYARGKAEALGAYATGRAILGAFGDSGFDIEMLAKAEVAVMVRPKDSLRKRSHEVTRVIEIARA